MKNLKNRKNMTCVDCQKELRRVVTDDNDLVADRVDEFILSLAGGNIGKTSNQNNQENNKNEPLIFGFDEDTEDLPLADGIDCDDVLMCLDCGVFQFICCDNPMVLFNINSEEDVEEDNLTDLREYDITIFKDCGNTLRNSDNQEIDLHKKIKFEYINGACGGQDFSTYCRKCQKELYWNDK